MRLPASSCQAPVHWGQVMSPQSSVDPNAPMVCTLGPHDLQRRFAAIRELAHRALLSHEQVGPTLRLRYSATAAAALERLIALERSCCAFLRFELLRHADEVSLDITAPAEAGEFAPLLYAHFVGEASCVLESASCKCASTT